MAIVDSIIVFTVSLLIGSAAIHFGAITIVGESDFEGALITALLGALVWSIVGFFFGWIPFLGPLITLFAWLGLVNWRYPGGWPTAAAIAVLSWIAVLAILYVLAFIGVGQFGAVGVPGV